MNCGTHETYHTMLTCDDAIAFVANPRRNRLCKNCGAFNRREPIYCYVYIIPLFPPFFCVCACVLSMFWCFVYLFACVQVTTNIKHFKHKHTKYENLKKIVFCFCFLASSWKLQSCQSCYSYICFECGKSGIETKMQQHHVCPKN